MWGLPEVFDIVDQENGEEDSRVQSVDQEEGEPQVELELVEGKPDWRKVNNEDTVYYFNVVTRETTWSLE